MDSDIMNKNKTLQKYWISLFALSVLILFGTWQPIFALAAFGIMAPLVFLADEDYIWMMLFYSMPLANIFKLSAGSTSLFTFLILIFVFRLFLKRQEIPAIIILFALYMILIPCCYIKLDNFDILRWIKLLSYLLLLFFYFGEKRDDMNSFLAYIMGIIVSSFIRYADSDMFRISTYVQMKNLEGSRELVRFSGLYADPNYYSVNLIISLCLVVILYHKMKIKLSQFLILSMILIFFVISTYSKSSILMTGLPIFLFLYSNNRTNKYGVQIFIAGLAFLGFSYLFFGGTIDVLKIVTERFQSSGGDVNKLTSGRADLWISYVDYLVKNPRCLIWGKGIGTQLLNGYGSHNSYIDLLYHLGIVGTVFLFSIFKQICQLAYSNIKRNIMNYCVLICIIVMYFFLGMLFYFDTPYHLIIAICVLNINTDEKVADRDVIIYNRIN